MKLIQSLCVFTLSLLFLWPVGAAAQEFPLPSPEKSPEQPACGSGGYSTFYEVPKGGYDIYVRLGQPGQQAQATLYYESLTTGGCQKIGTREASASTWQKIGSWATNENSIGTFTLVSPVVDGLPDANKPAIMLVDKKNPVCRPSTECYVKIDNERGAIRPSGVLENNDSLRVVRVIDPRNDIITSVYYYVDSQLAYSGPTLESFDLRYVPPGEHTIARVITYESGQKVVIQKEVERSYAQGANYLFYNVFYGRKSLWRTIGLIAAAVLALCLIMGIARWVHKRRTWKRHHFAQTVNQDEMNSGSPSVPHFEKDDSSAVAAAKLTLVIAFVLSTAITSVVVLNSFIMQFYQVDGPSMEKNFYTGQRLLVNRLGTTFAKISNRQFLPKRGEVVIFQKKTDVLLETGNKSAPEYVVKRVIGLPGDRVVIKKGKITIYNRDNPKGFNPEANTDWLSFIQRSDRDDINITIKEGEVFVVGDNRPESVDSRSYGPIATEQIIGKASFRVWPLSEFDKL